MLRPLLKSIALKLLAYASGLKAGSEGVVFLGRFRGVHVALGELHAFSHAGYAEGGSPSAALRALADQFDQFDAQATRDA